MWDFTGSIKFPWNRNYFIRSITSAELAGDRLDTLSIDTAFAVDKMLKEAKDSTSKQS